ncbi:B3 domain-containing protein Os02g0598200-like [Henckelia pumila]|uniref:B3 domain-containing protein Os02g0598200-like n=1 Tax=Henckelia pumila TaxID=405737 RepID=UPI003C6DC98D
MTEMNQGPKTSRENMKEPVSENASSPDVFRFFKPMFGEGFSEYLFLPPQIAPTMKHLVGEETLLQDSTGKTWPVSISYVDGLLAFHKGWDEFFIQHHLSIGQIVVFELEEGSLCFNVRIYDTDACETLDFDQEICETDGDEDKDEDVGEELSSNCDTGEEVSQALKKSPSNCDG